MMDRHTPIPAARMPCLRGNTHPAIAGYLEESRGTSGRASIPAARGERRRAGAFDRRATGVHSARRDTEPPRARSQFGERGLDRAQGRAVYRHSVSHRALGHSRYDRPWHGHSHALASAIDPPAAHLHQP
jgi:hypothetical protein